MERTSLPTPLNTGRSREEEKRPWNKANEKGSADRNARDVSWFRHGAGFRARDFARLRGPMRELQYATHHRSLPIGSRSRRG